MAAVENLRHSAEAYEAAKSRLERQFGGQRRQIYLHLEKLDQFRPIRPGNAKDLDRLADLLDVIVIKLKEAGRKEELGNGSLYMKIHKKITSTMLANYTTDGCFSRKKWNVLRHFVRGSYKKLNSRLLRRRHCVG